MIDTAEHFGQALRRLRTEQGLSLRDLEQLANMSKSKLQHLEHHDGRNVSLEDARHLDDKLNSGITLVSAAQRDQMAALTDVARLLLVGPNRYTDLSAALLTTRIEQQGTNAVDRRTFLQGAGIGLALPALALESARHGLGISMSDQVDKTVDEWAEIAHEHGFGYMTTPPDEFLESLMVDIVALQFSTANLKDDGKARELMRIGALLSALTAMTLANLDRLREGRRWWRTARQLADQSRDTRTQAWVYGREIVRSLYEQRPIGAIISMVDRFELAIQDAPQNSKFEFLGGKAQELALAGRDRHEQAARLLVRPDNFQHRRHTGIGVGSRSDSLSHSPTLPPSTLSQRTFAASNASGRRRTSEEIVAARSTACRTPPTRLERQCRSLPFDPLAGTRCRCTAAAAWRALGGWCREKTSILEYRRSRPPKHGVDLAHWPWSLSAVFDLVVLKQGAGLVVPIQLPKQLLLQLPAAVDLKVATTRTEARLLGPRCGEDRRRKQQL